VAVENKWDKRDKDKWNNFFNREKDYNYRSTYGE